MIDTVVVCPPLTLVEQQALRKLKAEASQRLLPERNKVRETYVFQQAQRLAATNNMSHSDAARVIEQQCKGVLLADVVLPFDNSDLSNVTVAACYRPSDYEGMTLADPIEGVEYGRCKAKIMRRLDGTPWINSFAHGRATYELKYDARAVGLRIEQAQNPVDAFVKLALLAELDEIETKKLIDQVARRAGTGVKPVAAKLKTAKSEQARRLSDESTSASSPSGPIRVPS